MKNILCLAIGAAGSVVVNFFVGLDTAFATLVIFMILNYITGFIVAVTGNLNAAKGDVGSDGNRKYLYQFNSCFL